MKPPIRAAAAAGITLLLATAGTTSAQSVADTGPDFSGVWRLQAEGASVSFSTEPPPPMTAWGAERFAANRPTIGPRATLDANDPTLLCLPPGIPYILTIPTPFEIIHTDEQLLQIFEYDHWLRRIHMDGRGHPDDLQSTGVHQWLGHSIGRWEEDTLVIETVGFNDSSWLDRSGFPHSEQLRVVERWHRADEETLIDEITIEDPQTYTRPWHGRLVFKHRPGWEIYEHICVSGASDSESYRRYRQRAWESR